MIEIIISENDDNDGQPLSGIINPTTKTGVLVSFSIDIVRMGTTQINRVVCSQQNVAIVGKYRKSQTWRQLVTSFQAVLELKA